MWVGSIISLGLIVIFVISPDEFIHQMPPPNDANIMEQVAERVNNICMKYHAVSGLNGQTNLL